MPIENIDIVNNPHYLYSGALVLAGLLMQTIFTGLLRVIERRADVKKERLVKLEELLRVVDKIPTNVSNFARAYSDETNDEKQDSVNRYALSEVKTLTTVYFNELSADARMLSIVYKKHQQLIIRERMETKNGKKAMGDEFLADREDSYAKLLKQIEIFHNACQKVAQKLQSNPRFI